MSNRKQRDPRCFSCGQVLKPQEHDICKKCRRPPGHGESKMKDSIEQAIDVVMSEEEYVAGREFDIRKLKVGDTVKDSDGSILAPVKGKSVILNRGHAAKEDEGIVIVYQPFAGKEITLRLSTEELAAINWMVGGAIGEASLNLPDDMVFQAEMNDLGEFIIQGKLQNAIMLVKKLVNRAKALKL